MLMDAVVARLEQDDGDSVRRGPAIFWLLGAAMACLVCLCLWRNHGFFHDDTYITLRYASHLLAGYGPIWNTQGPRVEGFTSPLHMLLVAALSATGLPMTMAARTVNVCSHLVLLVYVFFYLRPRVGALGAQLGVTLIGASWIFMIWDLGGLDAVLYAMLATIGVLIVTSAFYAEEGPRSRLLVQGSLVLALGTLARPEGFLLLCGAWILITMAPRIAARDRAWTLAASVGVAAVVLVPVEIFRWSYFHALAPNTMYAKIGGINRGSLIVLGLVYLAKFTLVPPSLGMLTTAVRLFERIKKRSGGNDAAIWMFIGVNALFVVVSGGDHMLAYRFCLPMYALLTVVLVRSLARNGFLDQLSAGPVCAALVLALALQGWPHVLNPKTADPAASVGKVVGAYINTRWPAGSTVALNTAGSTPFSLTVCSTSTCWASMTCKLPGGRTYREKDRGPILSGT